MSNIAFSGNASGTGTFTIASPNSNTDRTLTLPDATGTINTSGAVNEVPAGSAAAPSIYPTGDTNTGIFFPAADTIAFAEGGAEAMRIDSSGRVGIGTTSPSYRLDVSATELVAASVSSSYSGLSLIRIADSTTTSATAPYVGSTGDNLIFGRIGIGERARIDSSGKFLVGTTTTLNPDINNEFRGTQTNGGVGVLNVYNSSSSSADASPSLMLTKAMTTTTSSARFLQFYANGISTPMGGIVGNGSGNAQFATISDRREKENVASISGSLTKVLALNPVEFDWINSGEHCSAGFVAQDVEEVFPEFVIENFAQEGQEPRKGLTGGMTGGIIPHLVKAIQELKAELDTVKAEVEALKGQA